MKNFVTVVFLMSAVVLTSRADVTLPGLISDHMILHRKARVRIWGWADSGENVTVEFNGQQVTAVTGSDGTWSVWLKPMKAGGPYDLTVTGKNKSVIKDVLVGEVWVASGQSNMELGVCAVVNANEETWSRFGPLITFFTATFTVKWPSGWRERKMGRASV